MSKWSSLSDAIIADKRKTDKFQGKLADAKCNKLVSNPTR
jgi:hypothetical protein